MKVVTFVTVVNIYHSFCDLGKFLPLKWGSEITNQTLKSPQLSLLCFQFKHQIQTTPTSLYIFHLVTVATKCFLYHTEIITTWNNKTTLTNPSLLLIFSTMATSAFTNSLLSSSSLTSTQRLNSSTNNAFLPCRISLPRSHFSLKKTSKLSSFSIHCSLEASNQNPHEETTPIELSMFRNHSKTQKDSIFTKNFYFIFLCKDWDFKLIVSFCFAGYPAFPTVLDINQIREILPHRWVFFLTEKIEFWLRI